MSSWPASHIRVWIDAKSDVEKDCVVAARWEEESERRRRTRTTEGNQHRAIS